MKKDRDYNAEWIDEMVTKQMVSWANETTTPDELRAAIKLTYSEDDLGASIAYCPVCNWEVVDWDGQLKPHGPGCVARLLSIAAREFEAFSRRGKHDA